MNRIIAATVIGFTSGMLGTGLGGSLVLLFKKIGRKFMAILLGFTGGVMLSVVCFDLLPHAFHMGGMAIGFAGILLGGGIIFVSDVFMTGVSDIKSQEEITQKGFVKSGILLGLGIALHNFPEGLAIGSGFAAADSMGLSLAVTIGLHDMPEGIAMAVPLKVGGCSSRKIVAYTILAGIPTGIGALIGAFLGDISPVFISLCLGFAGGAMLYITCGELIPKTKRLHKSRLTIFGMLAGLLLGLYITRIFK